MSNVQNLNTKMMVWSFPFVVAAVLISWRFIDAWLAATVFELLKSSGLLRTSVSDIPDVLFVLVCIGSAVLWSRYFVLKKRKVCNAQVQFCKIAGSVLFLSYFLKWFLKIVFGRINTRIWLAHPVSDNFHWFQGGGSYSSFPSGHMTVFTAFFVSLWLIYPRYRTISIGFILALAAALIATDYHFLSDIIAGVYLGLIITISTKAILLKT